LCDLSKTPNLRYGTIDDKYLNMDQNQIKTALENSSPIACESCNNDTFVEANYLRRISKILTGASEDTIVPIPTMACTKCGSVNEAFQVSMGKIKDA